VKSAPADASLERLCADALARPADSRAIEFRGEWIGWSAIRDLALRLGKLIDASGAATPPRVALVARNRPSAVAAFLGLLARSCSIRMVYPFQSAEALALELAAIKPAAVVAAEEDFAEPVLRTLRAEGGAGFALREMGVAAVPGLERAAARQEAVQRPRIEILTSGTTGPPKPFALDYEIVARHIAAATVSPQARAAGQPPASPALLMFPVGNISGVYSTLPPLLQGQQMVLLERFTVEGWHDYVLRFKPAFSGMPPAGVQMVLDAGIPPADLACLRGLGTGAAPLDPGVQRAFEERYAVPILLSYGATELGGPVTRMTPELHAQWGERKFGSVGRAVAGVQLRVVDAETGAVLPPGREGILEVISPRVGPDWIRTTDIAVIDEDGFLFHRGRADGAIVRGGFKLLPATIEHALLQHPSVSAAAVVGIPDRRLGQVPAAAVQFKPGAGAPPVAELEAHLRSRIPATHIPVSWRLLAALPRTPSMKVDLPAVRRLFEA
jgi:long-chain acyl-CoA synthetase